MALELERPQLVVRFHLRPLSWLRRLGLRSRLPTRRDFTVSFQSGAFVRQGIDLRPGQSLSSPFSGRLKNDGSLAWFSNASAACFPSNSSCRSVFTCPEQSPSVIM